MFKFWINMGIVSINWKDNVEDLNEVIELAKLHGMKTNFTSSSRFVEWESSKEKYDALKKEISDKYLGYYVEWREI